MTQFLVYLQYNTLRYLQNGTIILRTHKNVTKNKPLLHAKYSTTVGPNSSLHDLTEVASNYKSHTSHKAKCKTPRDIKGAWGGESRLAEQQHQNQGVWCQKGNYGLSL